MQRKYGILPGDGIGKDVTTEALKVLEPAAEQAGVTLKLEHFKYGADHYLETGETLPDEVMQSF